MAFEAKFHQSCASCGEDVKGEQARYDGNNLVHDDCDGVTAAATELDRDAKVPVCTEHFLLQPCGDCEVS